MQNPPFGIKEHPQPTHQETQQPHIGDKGEQGEDQCAERSPARAQPCTRPHGDDPDTQQPLAERPPPQGVLHPEVEEQPGQDSQLHGLRTALEHVDPPQEPVFHRVFDAEPIKDQTGHTTIPRTVTTIR